MGLFKTIDLGMGLIIIFCFNLFAQNMLSGKDLYMKYCATCHGKDMDGGMAKSLTDGKWQFGATDAEIFNHIEEGIPKRGMPGFQVSMTEEDIEKIIVFIRKEESLQRNKEKRDPQKAENRKYNIVVNTWVEDLDFPWALDFIDKKTALISERPGYLRLVKSGKLQDEPIQGTPRVLHEGQGGLMDVAVDPDYSNNGWVYLSYSHILEEDDELTMTRIVRGKINKNKWANQQVLFEALAEHYSDTRHHYGSRIVFDKKGYLYFSIGDRGARHQAQQINRPNGKIHRIYKDGKIPKDNPFVYKNNAIQSIFSYGNRNPQGLAVHPQSDQVWETEHGPMGGDEVNLILSGKNYGWPEVTYGQNYDGTVISEYTEKPGMEPPVLHWTPSIAVCGLDFYTGNLFPKWQNDLIVGALRYEQVRILEIENNRIVDDQVILSDYGRVRDVTCGPDGAIYVVLNEPDKIIRITPIDK
jgi:glucose/arabinose dehydrogenase